MMTNFYKTADKAKAENIFYTTTDEGKQINAFIKHVIDTAPIAHARAFEIQNSIINDNIIEPKIGETLLDNPISIFTINSRDWDPKHYSDFTTMEQLVAMSNPGPIGNPILPKGEHRWAFFLFGKPSRGWFLENGYATTIIRINNALSKNIEKVYLTFIRTMLPSDGKYCSGLIVSHMKGSSVSFWLASKEGFEDIVIQKYLTFFKKMCPKCKVVNHN
jgi:hypothetical protein